MEHAGRVQEAADYLEQYALSAWPRSRAALAEAYQQSGGQLCPRAMIVMNDRRGRVYRNSQITKFATTLFFAFLWAGACGWSTYSALESNPWWFAGSALAGAAALLLLLASLGALFTRNAWQRAQWAMVVDLVHPEDHSSTCGAKVVLDTQPGKVHQIQFESNQAVDRGMRLLVIDTGGGVEWLP
ncbi:MAG: hypothetical protein HY898_02880 [Deltaproteobacteria bacterium]|nr:hypothetical protein [Deltaproteobacteria bacterium]